MAKRRIEIAKVDGTTSCVHLAGTWRLGDGLPTDAELAHDIELASAAPRVTFETENLGDWDSSLVTFLAGLTDGLRARHIALDGSGLPETMRRLLGLLAAAPESDLRSSPPRASWVVRLGTWAIAGRHAVIAGIDFLGEATIALGRLILGRARHRRSDLFHEVQEAGVRALPIVTLISFLLGMIMAFVGGVTLRNFGATIYVADLVAIAMVRELSAIMTAIIMAGRTGSAYAAELGTMRVSQETDALVTMGISPMEFIVIDRLVALSLMMPLLCIYADFVGIVAGGVVAVKVLKLTGGQYWQEIGQAITMTTFLIGIVKSAVFGVLVAMCGCLAGLRAGRSAAAVGNAATSAVVSAIVWIIATDGVFAIVLYLLGI
jgi:phospholipid/cholesterol/gamma-HCH transport system permease protein